MTRLEFYKLYGVDVFLLLVKEHRFIDPTILSILEGTLGDDIILSQDSPWSVNDYQNQFKICESLIEFNYFVTRIEFYTARFYDHYKIC